MRAAEAIAAGLLTLTLVVARPRGLNEGAAALLGGALVLLLGLVSLPDAARLEAGTWNVFLFFLSMMGTAAFADRSGVFDAVARAVARLSGGRIWLLFLYVFVLGAGISLFFANDSAALVLTPIVYALVMRLSLDPLPFVFATTFIADTASIGLPVSNPLNVIVVDSFHIGLGPYVERLWLPAVIAILLNVGAFFLIFRRQIRGRFTMSGTPDGGPGLPSTILLLGLLAAAYLAASAAELPLGVVAVAGAVALGLNLARLGNLDVRSAGREIGWPIFGFIAGMLIVVQALDSTGVTAQIGGLAARAAVHGHLAAIAAGVVGTALGANAINNLPMALVMVSAIHHLHAGGATRIDMVYATIVGADLGPNLTHLGSLATFIWLFFLRRKGLDVSTWDYLRVGVLVTPMMLLGAVLGLWITSSL